MSREPPSNIRAEQALLGAILANNKAFDLCGGLTAGHFVDPINAAIYSACARRIEAGRKVDAIMLWDALKNTDILADVGGAAYLTSLLAAMIGIINAGDYATAIRDCAARRGLIEIAERLSDQAYGTAPELGDAMEAASSAMAQIEQVTSTAGVSVSSSIGDAANEAIAASEAASRGENAGTRLLTGIKSLDALWDGIYPGSLEILGARTRSGKTTLALQIARHVASTGAHVGILSYEISKLNLGLVNLASLTGISVRDLRAGRFSPDDAGRMIEARRYLEKLPIDVIHAPGMPQSEAIAHVRIWRRRKGTRLIVVDHRELVGRDEGWHNKTDTQWLQHTTRRWKEAANSQKASILLLMQLNKGVEGRDDPRPRLADTPYGGDTDADNALLIYRPELSIPDEPPARKVNDPDYAEIREKHLALRASLAGVAEIIKAKARFGSEGMVPLRFHGPSATFSDWA